MGTTSSEGDVEVSNPNEAVELEAYGNENRILAALERVDRMLEAQNSQDDSAVVGAELVESSEIVEEQPVAELSAQIVSVEEQGEQVTEVETETALVETAQEIAVEAAPEPMIDVPTVETAVDAAGVAPEASESLALPAMADRDHAVPADGSAIERIKRSRGQSLPGPIAQKLGALLGHDFSHVQIHTDSEAAKAADALDARAFALGADVFFGSGEFAPGTEEGQELLAHELTHVVQHDEGRLPTHEGDGMAVSAPSDAAEVEARESASLAMDEAAAVGGFEMVEAPPVSAESHSAPDLEAAPAMREATQQRPRNNDNSPDGGQGAGSDQLQVRFGGRSFDLKLPSVPGPGETLRWSPSEIRIPGLNGPPRFEVTFGQDGMPTRGTVRCDLQFGSVAINDFELSMTSEGTVGGGGEVEVEIAELGLARVQVDFSGEGVSVEGTITAEDVAIPGVDWLLFTTGEVAFQADTNGMSANGSLNGLVEGIGNFQLGLNYEEGTLGGDFTLGVQEGGIQVTDQLLIERGSASGTFSPSGMELRALLHVNVRDLITADCDIQYRMPENLFTGTITMEQWPESFSLGENVEVSNTSVTVRIDDSELTSIEGGADFLFDQQWDGSVA